MKTAFFFLLETKLANQANYAHRAICLAEGFKELGIKCYGNIDYWKNEKGDYLINSSQEIKPENCDIIFFEDSWGYHNIPWPEIVFRKNRSYITVYLEHADNIFTPALRPGFPKFDFVFKSQMNSRLKYPKNFFPDVFGLSERIIKYTNTDLEFSERENRILVNFRVPHSLRKYIVEDYLSKINGKIRIDTIIQDMDLIPSNEYDSYLWLMTGRRHHPDYYQLLKTTKVSTCVGGGMLQPYPTDYYSKTLQSKFLRKFFKYTENIFGEKRIYQFDSWRLWETFGSGAISLHLDLEKYGADLPVMPINNIHYIGVDMKKPSNSIDILMSGDEVLSKIAENGKKWALEHYSPKMSAIRCLSIINRAS